MALKLIVFIFLIATSTGRPLEDDREAKLRQFHTSSSSSSSSVFVSNKPGQPAQSHQSSSVMVSTNTDGKVTQSEYHSSSVGTGNNQGSFIISSSSINGQKPHTVVITRDPVTGQVVKKEYDGVMNKPKTDFNPDSDPVQSDFAATNISEFPDEGESDFAFNQSADIPDNEDMSSNNEKEPEKRPTDVNSSLQELIQESSLPVNNKTSTDNRPAKEEPNSSSEGSKTETILNSEKPIAEELTPTQDKPSTTDMSNNPIMDQIIGGDVVLDHFTELTPVKIVESIVSNSSTSGKVNITAIANNTPQEPFVVEIAPKYNESSGVDLKTNDTVKIVGVSSVSVNGQKSVSTLNASNSSQNKPEGILDVTNNQTVEKQNSQQTAISSTAINNLPVETIATSTNPLQGQVQTSFQSSSVAVTNGSTGEAVFVSSSSVNGQKPITVVTASNPVTGEIMQTKFAESSATSDSSANREKPASSILPVEKTPDKPEKPLGVVNNKNIQGAITLSNTSGNDQLVEAGITSTNPLEGQITQSHFQSSSVTVNKNAAGGATIVSTNSVNEEKPVSIISVTNPVTGQITQSKFEGSLTAAAESQNSQGSTAISSSTVNRLPIKSSVTPTNPSGGQISQNQFASSTFTVNKNPTGGAVVVSTSSVNGEKPVTDITAGNSVTGQITQTKFKESLTAVNNPIAESQNSQGSIEIFSSTVNRLPIETSVTQTNPSGGQISQNQFAASTFTVNKNSTAGAVVVSTSSVNGEKPVTVITASNPVTGQIAQSKFEGSLTAANNPIAESQNSQGSIAISSSTENRLPIETSVTSTNPLGGQISQNTFQSSSVTVNRNPTAGAVVVSTSSVNGQNPVTVITANNLVTGENTQSKVEGAAATINNRLAENQNSKALATISTSVNQNSITKPAIGQNSNFESSSVLTNKNSTGAAAIVSSNSVKGEKPVRLSNNPIKEETMINNRVGEDRNSQGLVTASSTSINDQPVGTSKNPSAERGTPSFCGSSSTAVATTGESGVVSSGFVNGEKTAKVSKSPPLEKVTQNIQKLSNTNLNNRHISDQSYEESAIYSSIGGQRPSNSYQRYPGAIPTSTDYINGLHYQTVITNPATGGFVQTTYINPGSHYAPQRVLVVNGMNGHHIHAPYPPPDDYDAFHGDLSSLMDCDYPDYEEEYHQVYHSKGPSADTQSQVHNRFSSDEERVHYLASDDLGYSGTQDETVANDFEKYNYGSASRTPRTQYIWPNI